MYLTTAYLILDVYKKMDAELFWDTSSGTVRVQAD